VDESLPVGAKLLPPSFSANDVISLSLISASDETTVTLADYFHHLSPCHFLIIVLLRHFA